MVNLLLGPIHISFFQLIKLKLTPAIEMSGFRTKPLIVSCERTVYTLITKLIMLRQQTENS